MKASLPIEITLSSFHGDFFCFLTKNKYLKPRNENIAVELLRRSLLAMLRSPL